MKVNLVLLQLQYFSLALLRLLLIQEIAKNDNILQHAMVNVRRRRIYTLLELPGA